MTSVSLAGLEEYPCEVEQLDRRSGKRMVTTYRLVQVHHADDLGLGWCRNISDGGMKLNLGMNIELNDVVDVAFSPTIMVQGTVIWVDGTECGVRFANEIDSTELLSQTAAELRTENARAPRLKTELPARVYFDGVTKSSVIHDISLRGMKVASDSDFKPGLKVNVILANSMELRGVVRWTQEKIAGLFLLDSLSVTDLSSVRSLGEKKAF